MPPSSVAGGTRGRRRACRRGCGRCRGSRSWAWVVTIASGAWTSGPPPTHPPDTGADTIVVGVFEGKGDPARRRGRRRWARWSSPARRAPSSATLAVAHAGGQALDPGRAAGRATTFDAERARVAAAAALGRARELGARSLCWELPHKVPDGVPGALVEGTLLAAYRYAAFKSEPGEDRAPARADRLRPPRRRARRSSGPGRRRRPPTARATSATRPPNAMTPEALAERARALPGVHGRGDGPGGDRRRRDGRVRRGRAGRRSTSRSLITIRYEPAGAAGPLARARRQGGHVRLRRLLDQAGRADARDEVRHVRRGGRARGDRRRSRELGLPVRLVAVVGATENIVSARGRAPGRHRPLARRDHDRGQQHGRRGPARAGRLPHPRPRRGRRAADRPGDADRRHRQRVRERPRGR